MEHTYIQNFRMLALIFPTDLFKTNQQEKIKCQNLWFLLTFADTPTTSIPIDPCDIGLYWLVNFLFGVAITKPASVIPYTETCIEKLRY